MQVHCLAGSPAPLSSASLGVGLAQQGDDVTPALMSAADDDDAKPAATLANGGDAGAKSVDPGNPDQTQSQVTGSITGSERLIAGGNGVSAAAVPEALAASIVLEKRKQMSEGLPQEVHESSALVAQQQREAALTEQPALKKLKVDH